MELIFGGVSVQEECKKIKNSSEAGRTAVAVDCLRSVAGTEENVTKLSKVINQQLSNLFIDGLASDQGRPMQIAIEQGKSGEKVFRAPNGETSNVQARGIGGMRVSVDRNSNGDFDVHVNWDVYYKGPGRADDHKTFAGMDGAVIKGKAVCNFTIAGEGADVKFVEPPMVEIAFSGRMANDPEGVA